MRVWSEKERAYLYDGFVADERYLPQLKSRIRSKVRTMIMEIGKAFEAGIYTPNDITQMFDTLEDAMLSEGHLSIADELRRLKMAYMENELKG